ncbi:MAG: S8 family peptidase [bacterium]
MSYTNSAKLIGILLLPLFVLLGCGGPDPTPTTSTTKLIVRLTDAQAKSRTAVSTFLTTEYGVAVDGTSTSATNLAKCNMYVVDPSPALTRGTRSVDVLMQNLAVDSRIKWVAKNGTMSTQTVPTDDRYTAEWGMVKVEAEAAWDISTGAGTVIAIIDTGIVANHVEWSAVANKLVSPMNMIGDGSPSDGHGHGTHCAGIAAAPMNNGGVVGVAPNAKIMPVKVLTDEGHGSSSDIAAGIIYAADNGATVISMSLGSPNYDNATYEACQYAVDKGVIVVAAAGNNGSGVQFYPAAYPGVISVAATSMDDTRATFSNYGATWVDIAAPGVDITSTYPGGYKSLDGTSMACPFVAGACALLKSVHPDWGVTQVEDALYAGTDDIGGKGTLWRSGRLNLSKLINATPPDPPAATTFTDGDFWPSDWVLSTHIVGTGSLYATNAIGTYGGNPDRYLEVTTSVGGYAGDKGIYAFEINTTAQYTPKTQGMIQSINYDEDCGLCTGHGSGQSTGPALLQSGKYYMPLSAKLMVTGLHNDWQHLSVTDLQQNDFSCITDGTSPDFSATGSAIQLGFVRINTNSGWANTNIHIGGIDNWKIEVVR